MIGRADEATAIARFIDHVPGGPVGLLIEGEAGIGKTTVFHEAIRHANEQGYRVLQVRPAESEGDLSFAALTDLLGDTFDDVGDALPPPQRRALEVALLRREADAPADPRTTATAVLSAVTILCGRGPLVVAIDDAQWLDRASKRALEFVARRLPRHTGMIVASRIEGPGLPSPLDLVRALAPASLEHLVLGPLSPVVLQQLIGSRLQLTLPLPMLARVAEASGGNPFFALEISGALRRDGTDVPPLGDPLPVSGTLHELLEERVGRLSASARLAAAAAAALTGPTAAVIEAALGSDIDVDAALLEAGGAGVLASDGERIRFSHPLLASAIYRSLTAAGRRELHGRLAAAVSDPERQARHLARSKDVPDLGSAAKIEVAAVLATRRGAPESAAELYAAACRLTPTERSEDRARRLLGGADALGVVGDLGGARMLATQALELGRTASIRARALLLLGSLATYTETIEASNDLRERALTEAGDDRVLRIEILIALFGQIAIDADRTAQRADEAIGLLRHGDDAPSLARALICKFMAEAVLGHGSHLALLEEALRLEADSTGPRSMDPLIWYHWIDDLDATQARHRVLDQWYRDRGDVVAATELVELRAMAEFRAGNWAEAEQALEHACDVLTGFDIRGPFVASFADRSVIDAHRGRLGRARQTLEGILVMDRLDVFWRMACHSAQGAVEFCDRNYEAADRAWAAMRAEAQVVGWVDFLDDRSEPDHVETLLILGRLDEARRVLDHLEWRGRTLPRAWIDAGLPRARALILAAEGDLAAAMATIDAAPALRALPFEAARLLLVRGQLERRANRRLAARNSLTAALGAFEALGSPPWVQRAHAEIARLGLRHRAPDELTDSERRIAELAAAGMTNRQVAEVSFVSPKTVEANLARVYQKLGIHSRAELGARMTGSSRDVEAET
ncbi:MAG: ATP-binding protein [Candidatus Limnocylindrales bacterium]